MTKTYRAVMLTKKGGPEVLEQVELPMVEPGPGELRVRVLATGVGATDLTMRRGYYPYAPKLPFVQGYDTVGRVDAIGAGVSGFTVGEKVCALLVWGGLGEYVTRGAEHWVKVPEELDDAEVVALILNYATAYQALHRVAQLQAGQTALVNGANGGVGQALLELMRAHGVKAIGAAASAKRGLVEGLGAQWVEGRSAPADAGVKALYPDGLDAAFDGLGGAATGQCVRALKRGGVLVWYGFSGTGGSNVSLARGAAAFFVQPFFAGKRSRFYGITQLYRKDPAPLREDLPKLFDLLKRGEVKPRIAARMPLLEARAANERLERGGVDGKIVMVA
ncbi:MAG: zinc-binding dehydrogenase [Myxococcaceae bacterium]|nr:zinc-binding dehydrogenase [Myxococcaceae bacterium]